MVGRFAASCPWGGNHYSAGSTTARQATTKNRRCGRSRRHPRHDFPGNLSDIERRNFLIKSAKQGRVAPLKPDDKGVFLRCTHQKPIDLRLLGRLACIPLTDQDLLGLRRMIEHLGPNQRVIQHEICLFEHPEGAQGQQVSCAWTGPNKPDLTG
jgi:hypothetical protein